MKHIFPGIVYCHADPKGSLPFSFASICPTCPTPLPVYMSGYLVCDLLSTCQSKLLWWEITDPHLSLTSAEGKANTCSLYKNTGPLINSLHLQTMSCYGFECNSHCFFSCLWSHSERNSRGKKSFSIRKYILPDLTTSIMGEKCHASATD